jgi:hypothetical protein
VLPGNSSVRINPPGISIYFRKRSGLKVENQLVLNYVKSAIFVWPTIVHQVPPEIDIQSGAGRGIF